jgi:hypothetical protein
MRKPKKPNFPHVPAFGPIGPLVLACLPPSPLSPPCGPVLSASRPASLPALSLSAQWDCLVDALARCALARLCRCFADPGCQSLPSFNRSPARTARTRAEIAVLFSYLMNFIYLYLCLYVYVDVIVDTTLQLITLNQRSKSDMYYKNKQSSIQIFTNIILILFLGVGLLFLKVTLGT